MCRWQISQNITEYNIEPQLAKMAPGKRLQTTLIDGMGSNPADN